MVNLNQVTVFLYLSISLRHLNTLESKLILLTIFIEEINLSLLTFSFIFILKCIVPFLIFRARLVVCLEESLYIHNIRDMKVLHTIRDTPPNPQGLCALSINSDNCFIAYPGSSTIGEVQIFDAINLVRNLQLSLDIDSYQIFV